MKIQRALILAAGFGQRLRPLTNSLPKPLLEVNNITLLENTLKFLKGFGIKQIAINVHYLADQVKNFLKKFEGEYNINLFEEEIILNTGGALLNCLNFFQNDKFIVINPDTIWNFKYKDPLNDLIKCFEKEEAQIGLLVIKKNKSFDERFNGDFYRDENNNNLILRKIVKNRDLIYTGCQIIDPIILKNKKIKPFSINLIWDEVIKKKRLVAQQNDRFTTFYHIADIEIYKKIKKLQNINL